MGNTTYTSFGGATDRIQSVSDQDRHGVTKFLELTLSQDAPFVGAGATFTDWFLVVGRTATNYDTVMTPDTTPVGSDERVIINYINIISKDNASGHRIFWLREQNTGTMIHAGTCTEMDRVNHWRQNSATIVYQEFPALTAGNGIEFKMDTAPVGGNQFEINLGYSLEDATPFGS